MAAGSYTTEALVSSVRRRAFLPPADDAASYPRDSDIIATANEEMVGFLVPWILKAREGHFIVSTDIPLVAGVYSYTIPSRATADDISVIQLVDSSGAPVTYLNPVQTELELGIQQGNLSSFFGLPNRYYFQANSIVLTSTPAGAASLRVFYPQRPNQMVASASAAVVTSFPGGAPVGSFRVGFSTAPATFLSALAYEGVHSQPGFEVYALGAATSVTGTYAEFVGTLPSGLGVGDYLCLQDTAPVMTYVPADLFPMFAQWLATKLAKGDQLEIASDAFKASAELALEFMKRRDMLGHRKFSAQASGRRCGKRPPFWVR